MAKLQSCRYALCWASILILLLTGSSFATEISLQADTVLRTFERDTNQGTDQSVFPGYLYLQGELGTLDTPGLSFHFNGWGRSDITNTDYYPESSTAELLYGYLEYASAYGENIKLGRFHTFAGVANDLIDGIQVISPLNDKFSITAYGGLPVGLDDDGYIYGGRLGHKGGSSYDIGLSYQLENGDISTAEEWAAIDLALFHEQWFSIYGISRYSLEHNEFAEHSYQANISLKDFYVLPILESYNYDAALKIGENAVNPFRALAISGEELTIYGAGVQHPGESFDAGIDYRHYNYKLADSSDYVGVNLTWRGDGRTRFGGEIGLMKSDTAVNDYQLYRVYAYLADQLLVGMINFVSGDFQLVKYDQAMRNESTAWTTSLGCGWNLLEDRLSVKVTGDYSSNPYYDEDLRSMLTLTWHYQRPL